MSNITFLNNVQAQPWDAIVASSGAKISVGDSLLQGNQGLQFGILSKGVQGQGVGTITVERTDFVNNVGFNDPDVSSVNCRRGGRNCGGAGELTTFVNVRCRMGPKP